ncbi:RNA polymerase subunit sigma-70 [Cryptosporangium phraense]|uniref:RNA polymerase sigma factor n=1 Tax=Cryptosporangium phraense TaxID=2593070 RepID=A0A545AQ92_9ACTN|nr:RNA polymerase subunit sigma-70 [Cryptosporangium phraense]TQS43474.1 sigma-70 family RNA polymerase sigma factor [Cryptosporangium phraense]
MPSPLELARRGDQHAFDALVGPYRTELQVHCYRMLGSLQDAEDVTQETLLAAWTGLAEFEARSSVRTWLYRIATNRCLNHRRSATRRPQPTLPAGVPAPASLGEVAWLQPFPDALLDAVPDRRPGPEARYESREAITLAFVTAMQQLPPRQRATLILRDVLGYPAKDTAEMLDITVVAANNALKRARATLRRSSPPIPDTPSKEDEALLERFVDAFLAFDVDAMVDLMSDDVWLTMPPAPYEYHGRDAAHRFFSALAADRQPIALAVPTRANTQPAWGHYHADPATGLLHLAAVEVVAVRGGLVSALTRFEPEVGRWFGLAPTLRP